MGDIVFAGLKSYGVGLVIVAVMGIGYKAVTLGIESFKRMEANDAAYGKIQAETERRSRENCLKRGGVVVVSTWDGRIKECK